MVIPPLLRKHEGWRRWRLVPGVNPHASTVSSLSLWLKGVGVGQGQWVQRLSGHVPGAALGISSSGLLFAPGAWCITGAFGATTGI